jgi:hypothetical protein
MRQTYRSDRPLTIGWETPMQVGVEELCPRKLTPLLYLKYHSLSDAIDDWDDRTRLKSFCGFSTVPLTPALLT